jgi:hypothetical protein
VHGSSDSLDVDVFVLVADTWMDPNVKPNVLVSECSRLAEPVSRLLGVATADVNCNICVVHDGVMVWSAKGDHTESNNALLRTYALHKQVCPCFVARPVQRNVPAKIHRGVRGALACFTRTQHRTQVKACLRSKVALRERLLVLRALDLRDLVWEAEQPILDELKRAAFQSVQLLYLLRGVEVFTKGEVCESVPSMTVFMKRRPAGRADMVALMDVFCQVADAVEAYQPCVLDQVEVRHYGGTGDNGGQRPK